MKLERHCDEISGMEMYSSRLSCGMGFFYVPLDNEVKVHMFHLFTRFGSIDAKFRDASGKAVEVEDGTAHFLEHCAFYDADGKDSSKWFKKRGICSNAWTSNDHTNYHFESAGGETKKALDYLIGFVTEPHFTDEVVKKEQGVISQEIAMYKDMPDSFIHELIDTALFKDHPLRRSIVGDKDTIMRITKEYLISAHGTFYYPSNLNLVAFAPAIHEPAAEAARYLEMAERICSKRGFAYKAPPEYIAVEEPAEVKEKKAVAEHKVAEPKVLIGFKGNLDTSASIESRLRTEIINDLLAESLFSKSSEAVQKLVDAGIIRSDSFGANHQSGRGFGEFIIGGNIDNPDTMVNGVLSMIKSEVNGRLSRELVELTKMKNVKVMAQMLELNDPTQFASFVVFRLAADFNPMDHMRTLMSVTYEDVLEAGKKYLGTDNYSVAVLMPRK